MNRFLNQLIDRAGDLVAARPGLLPLVGVGLIIVNLILQIVPGPGAWLVDSHLVLHIGLVVGIVGLLLVRPLG